MVDRSSGSRNHLPASALQQFVTEDAYIRQGFGTAAHVQYGGKQIGPSGAMAAPFQASGFGKGSEERRN